METDKKILRQHMRQLRDQLSEEDVSLKSRKIFEKIINHTFYEKAEFIFSYMSFRNEVDTSGFHKKALKDGKTLLLPRVLSRDRMEFYKISDSIHLKKNSMGIMEPDDSCELYIHENQSCDRNKANALMLLPGLAYDHTFGRLGYGGGYYDRYLEKNACGIIRCGVGFECQLIDKIPQMPYDICMDVIVTDEEWLERVNVR